MPNIKVTIHGADDVIRALRKLPADAQDAMKAQARDIATSLEDFIKLDARRHSRQAARASRTVRAGNAGMWPVITASNSGRAKGLLFGSVFGMKRRSGWYSAGRYTDKGKQFGEYIGFPGSWFFSTAEDKQPWIESEWHGAADEVVRRWGA
jgi:hypothetical protein